MNSRDRIVKGDRDSFDTSSQRAFWILPCHENRLRAGMRCEISISLSKNLPEDFLTHNKTQYITVHFAISRHKTTTLIAASKHHQLFYLTMPPLHMMPNNNNNPRMAHRVESFDDDGDGDDDDDDSSFVFRPLSDGIQRRLSDLSDCSDCCSACPVPPPCGDHAPRMDRFRPLRAQKVAVIIDGDADADERAGRICGSVLKRDGHRVTVFSPPSSSRASGAAAAHQRQHYAIDSLEEEEDVRHNARIVKMSFSSEKNGNGWTVTWKAEADGEVIKSEFFDFVVIAASDRGCDQLPMCFPGQDQEQILSSLSLQCLYRNMISPDVPNLALMPSGAGPDGGSCHDDYSYVASIWLSTVLYKEMTLPSPQEQRRRVAASARRGGNLHKREDSFVHVDLLMQDLGLENKNGNASNGIIRRLFGLFYPNTEQSTGDYGGTLRLVQHRRRLAGQEGWAVQLYPLP